MKKLSAIVLSAILVLALSACGNSGSASGDTKTQGTNAMQQIAEAISSQTAKITRDEAIDKALADAGLTRENVRALEAELDLDRNGLYWEVEFVAGTTEYDYDINAETGELFRIGAQPPAATEQGITRQQAIETALSAAGLTQESVRNLESELDREHGGIYWEVDFEYGNTEYSYHIDASTGEIIRSQQEPD